MPSQLIKICGIKDADTATAAVTAGADYIGIIFHPASHRNVHLEDARKIAAATLDAGGTPVAVFVDQDASAMQSICAECKINTVQLHGDKARQSQHLLPSNYQRIYVLPQDDCDLPQLDVIRDFILIDHPDPGHGKTLKWSTFKYSLPFRWILAGGLTPANVTTAINMLQPNGVDVSTGVEALRGTKDMNLIQEFITKVKG